MSTIPLAPPLLPAGPAEAAGITVTDPAPARAGRHAGRPLAPDHAGPVAAAATAPPQGAASSAGPGLAEAPAAFLFAAPVGAASAGAVRRDLDNHLGILDFFGSPGADTILDVPLAGPGIGPLVKRSLDLVLSLMAAVVLAPVLAVIAMLLALEGGPVLFVQRRVGRGRQRFACFKFRTMRPDAQARLAALLAADPAARRQWQLHQKLDHDPRITTLGRFLRASSLDELPQLLNVVRGEMSLVGPRPVIAPEIDGYDQDRTYYQSAAFADYAACRPGITGLWQVSGRHRTTYAERIRLDRRYVREWSVLLDLSILARTVRVVLARSGS